MKTLIIRFYDARTNSLISEIKEDAPSFNSRKLQIIEGLNLVQADYEIFEDQETQDFTIQAKIPNLVVFYSTL